MLFRMKTRRTILSKIKKLQLSFLGYLIRAKNIEWDLCSTQCDKKGKEVVDELY